MVQYRSWQDGSLWTVPDKQGRSWQDGSYWAIMSGSTLFATSICCGPEGWKGLISGCSSAHFSAKHFGVFDVNLLGHLIIGRLSDLMKQTIFFWKNGHPFYFHAFHGLNISHSHVCQKGASSRKLFRKTVTNVQNLNLLELTLWPNYAIDRLILVVSLSLYLLCCAIHIWSFIFFLLLFLCCARDDYDNRFQTYLHKFWFYYLLYLQLVFMHCCNIVPLFRKMKSLWLFLLFIFQPCYEEKYSRMRKSTVLGKASKDSDQ